MRRSLPAASVAGAAAAVHTRQEHNELQHQLELPHLPRAEPERTR